MVDAGIGRLLISSLHQGITDISPNRLEFYEEWLSPTGMRDGRIGLAPAPTSALLALFTWITIYLVPVLKYPANPPSIGSATPVIKEA